MKSKSIDELVVDAQNGDNEAFGSIYDAFLTDIYRFIYYKVQNQGVAEDLTEDTFLKAWKKLDSYKKEKHPFSSWLYRIALNTVIDYTRKEHVHFEEIEVFLKDEKMDTKEQTEQYYNKKILESVLSKLPEAQKEVVILRYINELDYSEISEIVGKSEQAIRTLVSRGLQKLKDVIKKLDIDV